MIAFVEGSVVEVGVDRLLLAVGGFGIELIATPKALSACSPGATVRLATHLVVREDGWSLYGFPDTGTRKLFAKLLEISGVGPKLALGLLTALSPAQIAAAVEGGDAALLAPGGERRQQAAIDMARIGASMPAHLLEGHVANAAADALHLIEPAAEPQEAHATAFEAARPQGEGAGGDVGRPEADRPAGGGAQVEGEDCRSARGGGRKWRGERAACASSGHGESRNSHDGLRDGMIVVRAATARFLAELVVAARQDGVWA